MPWLDTVIETETTFGSDQETVQTMDAPAEITTDGGARSRTQTTNAPEKTRTMTRIVNANTTTRNETNPAYTVERQTGSHYGYRVSFTVPYHPGQKEPIDPTAAPTDC